MMSTTPLLNSDVGEDNAFVHDGRQAALLDLVQLANVACGGHAGDRATVAATLAQCKARGVHVGAHPSVPDRAHFGRVPIDLPRAALLVSVQEQVALVVQEAAPLKVTVEHVKPHGVLYHLASEDAELALALAVSVRDVLPQASWVLRAGSVGLAALRASGLHVLGEGFVDRRYAADGGLIPRGHADALVDSPEQAAAQAVRLAHRGDVDTLCIHGDGPHALVIARAVRAALAGRGTA